MQVRALRLQQAVLRAVASRGITTAEEFRAWLLQQLESGGDRRYERYWQLLAIINGWPAQPAVMPAAEWLTEALRRR